MGPEDGDGEGKESHTTMSLPRLTYFLTSNLFPSLGMFLWIPRTIDSMRAGTGPSLSSLLAPNSSFLAGGVFFLCPGR